MCFTCTSIVQVTVLSILHKQTQANCQLVCLFFINEVVELTYMSILLKCL